METLAIVCVWFLFLPSLEGKPWKGTDMVCRIHCCNSPSSSVGPCQPWPMVSTHKCRESKNAESKAGWLRSQPQAGHLCHITVYPPQPPQKSPNRPVDSQGHTTIAFWSPTRTCQTTEPKEFTILPTHQSRARKLPWTWFSYPFPLPSQLAEYSHLNYCISSLERHLSSKLWNKSYDHLKLSSAASL